MGDEGEEGEEGDDEEEESGRRTKEDRTGVLCSNAVDTAPSSSFLVRAHPASPTI